MSDTVFTALSTKIRATWLNVQNALAYYGRSPSYASSTGTANAYVLTLTATSLYTAYVDGDEFTFKANFANTDAATFQVVGASSLAAKDIYMGGAALSAGQIQIGDIVKVRYDGTRFQLIGGTPLARFLQSGIGAIAEDMQSRNRWQVHLTDFMSDADRAAIRAGTETNIDTAVVAALASLRTTTPNPGGKIIFPAPAQLKVTTPIAVTTDGVVLEGDTIGANRTDEQGSTVINCETTLGLSVDGVFGFVVKGLAFKNATVANIKINNTQHFVIDRCAALGSSSPKGIWITGTSYFGQINFPTISGLAGVGAVGLTFDDGSNEHVVIGGAVRQNTTQIVVDGSNNVRLIGIDCEGSSSQTGVSIAPTSAADAYVNACRFETLGIGILLGTNAKGAAVANWYASDTQVGISGYTTQNFSVYEPLIYNAVTPGALGFQITDPLSTGVKFGATTIKNISGGAELTNASGKWVISTSGGNVVQIGAAITGTDGSASAPTYGLTNSLTSGMYRFADGQLGFTCGGVAQFRMLSGAMTVHGSNYIGWESSTVGSGVDTRLARDSAAGVLAQKSSTQAQTFNHYGSEITAGTRYSRLAIKHATTTLASVSGATVTATNLIPAKANVLGVNTIVTVDLGTGGGTTGYTVGDGVDADRWGAKVGTVAGTDTDGNDATADPTGWFTAANNVVITATGGNFNGTGSIFVDVAYTITEAE